MTAPVDIPVLLTIHFMKREGLQGLQQGSWTVC